MDVSRQKEQFSIAYLRAITAVAGFSVGSCEVDDDSVDVTIGSTGGAGTIRSPKIDVQLKCTERNVLKSDGVHFALKRKNFDDLRQPNVMIPRILVVLLVPPDLTEWLAETPEHCICLHRCAWWRSLLGEPDRSGVDKPTVVLPRDRMFTVASLRAMMQTVAERGTL